MITKLLVCSNLGKYLQPHTILWLWFISRHCGVNSNQGVESIIQTSNFSPYAMENLVAYFLAYIYVVHGQIIGEAHSDVV